MNEYWSYILTAIGLVGFHFVAKKQWWAWWINVANQVLWFTFAIVTQQYGFIAAACAYTFFFTKNALEWTKEHKLDLVYKKAEEDYAKIWNQNLGQITETSMGPDGLIVRGKLNDAGKEFMKYLEGNHRPGKNTDDLDK